MAQSKTPAKRARRAEANRLRNKANKSRLKTAIKKYEQALQDGDVETARQRLIAATSLIDKNVSKGICTGTQQPEGNRSWPEGLTPWSANKTKTCLKGRFFIWGDFLFFKQIKPIDLYIPR